MKVPLLKNLVEKKEMLCEKHVVSVIMMINLTRVLSSSAQMSKTGLTPKTVG